MVDVALHFHKTGHRGKIYAISTHGMLPVVHKLGFTYPSFAEELEPMNRITDILKSVRRDIGNAEATGSNWRAVIDSLRPATQKLWLALPLAETRYFMQHLSRYWNVARHRMTAEAGKILDEMKLLGTLQILKGRLKGIAVNDAEKFQVVYGSLGRAHYVSADVLVNCIGSEANFAKIDSEFLRNLVQRRHIRNDDLSLGIKADPDGKVLDKHDKYSPFVYSMGTALKGKLLETTAIPEIRTQSRDLALKLLAD